MKCKLCEKEVTFEEWFTGDCPNGDNLKALGHLCLPEGELNIRIPRIIEEKERQHERTVRSHGGD